MPGFGGTVKLSGESEYRKALREITSNLREVSSELKLTNTQFNSGDKTLKDTKSSYNSMNTSLKEQREKVSSLREELKKAEAEYGSNNEQVKRFKTQLNNAEAQLVKMENETGKNNQELKEMKNSFGQAGEGAIKFGDILKANVIGDLVVSGIKAVGSAIKTISSKIGEVAIESLNARGELEQQVGGIETLFKDSSNVVIENANNAYRTAGMSAVNYMSTATSFSASLLQSLGGDTKRVAEVTDMAIIDMSDNANKMGTSMESIENAYQGFAKQNYTMLDNLKLGYGGTKSEMERLLKDAEKITGIKYDISNLSDVYEAIHVIQGELDITGTTAKEASETFQGSLATLKASWDNFLSGSGNLSQVVESVSTVAKNVIEIAKGAMPEIIESISEALPEFLNLGQQLLQEIMNGIVTYLPQMAQSAIQIIQSLAQQLIQNLPQIMQVGIEVITQLISGIGQMLPELIPQAVQAIITIVEGLLDNIDQLIDAGIQLIIGLAEGLIEAIPILIEKIPDIIEKLVMAIANNLPKIIEAGITIIIKLAEGLIQAIPQLISKIPQIISSLVNGFISLCSNMAEVGKNLVQGIWDGINNAKQWILDKIKGFGEAILNGIKSFFGIHSPSTLFRDEVGKFMAQGIGIGFTDEMKDITGQMQDAIPTKFNVDSTLNGGANNTLLVKDIIIEAFKEFKPAIILNGKEIGEYTFEYGNAKGGMYLF